VETSGNSGAVVKKSQHTISAVDPCENETVSGLTLTRMNQHNH